MSEYSYPPDSSTVAQAGSPNRFSTWQNGTDAYSHSQLAGNFERVDALLGRPSNGAAWPATEGAGGGVYYEIQLLKRERTFLGAVVDMWIPATLSATVLNYISGTLNPAGWYVCDGSTVGPSTHQFPMASGQAIQLPNLLNQYRTGANPSATPGSVGTRSDQPSGAPGLTLSPSANKGANSAGTVGTNIDDFNYVIPNHQHNYDHTHTANAPFASGVTGVDGDNNGVLVEPRAAGSVPNLQVVSAHYHTHGVAVTVAPPGINAISGSLTSPAGTYTIAKTQDNRPLSMACVPMIKIAFAS